MLAEAANLVGRDRDCAVRLDSSTLSRRHARLVVTNGVATVEDLGSKNGTYVNGQLVQHPVALSENDQIRFGAVAMSYRIVDIPLPSTSRSRRVLTFVRRPDR